MAVGVFGLQVAFKLKRTELLSLNNTHGWFGGGLSSTTLSTVDRIDFSNDTSTSSPRGILSVARRSLSAVGNSNYGWFGGGWFTPSNPQINYSTIDRIDFSNDSATALARGPLASTRYSMGATRNSNYGWFGGGQLFDPVTPSNTRKTSVDRIDFSNDSPTASPRGPLSRARTSLAATGNSNYGWFGGGQIPAQVSTVDRIDFSNDLATAPQRGPLSLARSNLAATGNSNYGWFGGGYDPVFRSTVDRIDFSNDLVTAPQRGPLTSTSRNRFAATGNSNYGWFGGGAVSAVDRIDFSNDLVIASSRASLRSTRENPGATSGQAKSTSILLQKTGNFGWFGGGSSGAVPFVGYSRVDRIDFSTDLATASVRGSLGSARYVRAATGNFNYGWFGGQFDLSAPGRVSTVDRINFSNDLATTSVRGPLSLARSSASATGNSNYGWFAGGYPGFVGTIRVDRIDFSNDSAVASVRGSLSSSRYNISATGNSNYGWFGGGTIQPSPGLPSVILSTVSRIDFSNDNETPSPRGPLSLVRSVASATGNSNYGWFGGGAPGPLSSVDRIDFSNDSETTLVRGPLGVARQQLSATGNSNYGWFGGGSGPSSRVDRIDFSNDLSAASLRGSLSLAKTQSAATSNTPIG